MRKTILAFILIGLLFVGYVAWQAISFLGTPAQLEKSEVVFEVPNGTAFYTIASQLEAKGLIRSARDFKILAKLLNRTTQVKVGEYLLNTHMRPKEVLDMLVSGKSISYNLTVPEGFNIYEIRDQLNKLWAGRGDEFFKYVTDPAQVKILTGETYSSLEGYLYPETYSITKYTSIDALVKRMYDSFLSNIADINKSAKVKMPLHDQVILASVIEKETGAASERPIISSVFHNRLVKKMRLQSDPTILYGLFIERGEIQDNITKADILKPTPYNTYTVPALPVGPIANPGREALWAAVHPLESDYLYFVSQNNGTHVFTSNYVDHEKAVRKFQLDRKMREGTSWRDLNKNKSQSQQ